MKDLYSQGTPIDMLTLPAELEKEGKLPQAGGREYIFEMMESVASSANVDWNLQHLRDKYVLRKLIKMSSDTIKKAMDAGNNPDEVLQAAEKDVFAIAEKQVKNTLRPIENFVNLIRPPRTAALPSKSAGPSIRKAPRCGQGRTHRTSNL